jgi:hypothetical protein
MNYYFLNCVLFTFSSVLLSGTFFDQAIKEKNKEKILEIEAAFEPYKKAMSIRGNLPELNVSSRDIMTPSELTEEELTWYYAQKPEDEKKLEYIRRQANYMLEKFNRPISWEKLIRRFDIIHHGPDTENKVYLIGEHHLDPETLIRNYRLIRDLSNSLGQCTILREGVNIDDKFHRHYFSDLFVQALAATLFNKTGRPYDPNDFSKYRVGLFQILIDLGFTDGDRIRELADSPCNEKGWEPKHYTSSSFYTSTSLRPRNESLAQILKEEIAAKNNIFVKLGATHDPWNSFSLYDSLSDFFDELLEFGAEKADAALGVKWFTIGRKGGDVFSKLGLPKSFETIDEYFDYFRTYDYLKYPDFPDLTDTNAIFDALKNVRSISFHPAINLEEKFIAPALADWAQRRFLAHQLIKFINHHGL